jgi:hypothetical protein
MSEAVSSAARSIWDWATNLLAAAGFGQTVSEQLRQSVGDAQKKILDNIEAHAGLVEDAKALKQAGNASADGLLAQLKTANELIRKPDQPAAQAMLQDVQEGVRIARQSAALDADIKTLKASGNAKADGMAAELDEAMKQVALDKAAAAKALALLEPKVAAERQPQLNDANARKLDADIKLLSQGGNQKAGDLAQALERARTLMAEGKQDEAQAALAELTKQTAAEGAPQRAARSKEAMAAADKAGNERLEQLRLKPKQGETEEEFLARIAAENGTATEEDQIKRLREAEALFKSQSKDVAAHAAELLYRAQSLGMGDSEPLLVQYGTELSKGRAGDRGKMKGWAEILAKRMEEKGLFGRYVGDLLTGTGAVELLQNADATTFFFWSMTEPMADKQIDTAKLRSEIALRLEKSPAGGIFDNLNFGAGWDDKAGHFRVIFEEISGAYANKAIAAAEAAKQRGGGADTIVITALRGVNMDSVLGKTEWPNLKKTLKDGAFKFEAYQWGGPAKNFGVPLPKSTVFASGEFKLVCFDKQACTVRDTLTTIGEVDATTWNFPDYDEVTQHGGYYAGGKGPNGSFAALPVAWFKDKLVGKDPSGNIWFMKPDGSADRNTNKNEDAFILDPT